MQVRNAYEIFRISLWTQSFISYSLACQLMITAAAMRFCLGGGPPSHYRTSNQTIGFQLFPWYACAVRPLAHSHKPHFCQNPNGVCVRLFEYRLFPVAVFVRSRDRTRLCRGLVRVYYELGDLVRVHLHVNQPQPPSSRKKRHSRPYCYHVSDCCCVFVSGYKTTTTFSCSGQGHPPCERGDTPPHAGGLTWIHRWQKGRALKKRNDILRFLCCLSLQIVLLIVTQLALIGRAHLRTMFLRLLIRFYCQ